jgi:hypothetical protein
MIGARPMDTVGNCQNQGISLRMWTARQARGWAVDRLAGSASELGLGEPALEEGPRVGAGAQRDLGG